MNADGICYGRIALPRSFHLRVSAFICGSIRPVSVALPRGRHPLRGYPAVAPLLLRSVTSVLLRSVPHRIALRTARKETGKRARNLLPAQRCAGPAALYPFPREGEPS